MRVACACGWLSPQDQWCQTEQRYDDEEVVREPRQGTNTHHIYMCVCTYIYTSEWTTTAAVEPSRLKTKG